MHMDKQEREKIKADTNKLLLTKDRAAREMGISRFTLSKALSDDQEVNEKVSEGTYRVIENYNKKHLKSEN